MNRLQRAPAGQISGWKARATCFRPLFVFHSCPLVSIRGSNRSLRFPWRLRVRHFACKVPIQGRSRAGKPELRAFVLHSCFIRVHSWFKSPLCISLRGFAASREMNHLQRAPAAQISGWQAEAPCIRVPFVSIRGSNPPHSCSIRVHSWRWHPCHRE